MIPSILFIVYDNESRINLFPQSTAYLHSYLLANGYSSDLFLQDAYHFTDEKLDEFLDQNSYNIICVSFIGGYFQYNKIVKISKIINLSQNRPDLYILGGHGPSPEPLFFLEKTDADIIVHGEGEETLLEIVSQFPNIDYQNIKGISYIQHGEFCKNQDRGLIQNIDSLPIPDYGSFPIAYYKNYPIANSSRTDSVMSVLTSRGCTFSCTFCYRMDTSYRKRDPNLVLDEVEFLIDCFNITYINFTDELLMSDKQSVEELCNLIKERKLKFRWYCNGRLNYATKSLLQIMKDAGCVYINYGVESLDNTVLKNMRKGLTEKRIREGVQNTIDVGIDPGINIIFGNIGDTGDTLKKSVEFMKDNCVLSEMRTIRPVTPYPGSALYYTAIELGLLKDIEDFYKKHVNSDLLTVNFTELTDSDFYSLLAEANKELIKKYYLSLLGKTVEATDQLYSGDASFRGFRQT